MLDTSQKYYCNTTVPIDLTNFIKCFYFSYNVVKHYLTAVDLQNSKPNFGVAIYNNIYLFTENTGIAYYFKPGK